MAIDHLPAARVAALLTDFGYPAPAVEEFTAELRDRIQDFQRDAGMPPSGNVTRAVSQELRARPTLARGSSLIQVRAFQQAMRNRGYRIRVDGVFAGLTDAALRDYQGAVAITRSGVVDAETWEALGWTPGDERDPGSSPD